MALYIPWLADAARSTGYPVVEIPGWRSRGHGGMRLVEGVVGHHTGTPRSAPGDYPSLNVVTNGRSNLLGPLCNLGLGKTGTIYVVAAGLAYHAGASRFVDSQGRVVFVDLNDEFVGIEAESDGSGTWSDAQLDCYPKLTGALLKYMTRGVERYVSHRTCAIPAGRKPDPTGISDGWMRQHAALAMAGGGSGGGSKPAQPPEPPKKRNEQHEEYMMEPLILGPTKDGGAEQLQLVHTGAAAVLNVIPLTDLAVFFGNSKPEPPVYCWGTSSGGGMGGGQSTIPGRDDRRAERNKPQQYDIPAGTTRIATSYSTNGKFAVQIVPRALL
ncbi:N-acetylmuramoyl-L-alanine amidase [Amycolatopsis thailandensis]|uniref:peptidoglycan recognition protein family protein n=1 Tax=Amycolatopsis thailandensis TaxID=589330 RepID=UPI003651A9C2